MGYPERKKNIIAALDQKGNLDVHQLARKLNISPVTIRRDLQQLSEEGLLVRTHGGAMKNEEAPAFTAFTDKIATATPQKAAIGKLAASFVEEGDIIFMDCGSTVFQMCAHLKNIPRLTVITNSLPVVAACMNFPGVHINLVGGETDMARMAIHGQRAISHISSYHAAKAFIGTDGLSVKNGLTANSEKEASVSSAMSAQAATVYMLCDASKIGHDRYVRYAPLSLFNFLVTDKGITAAQLKTLRAHGVKVLH